MSTSRDALLIAARGYAQDKDSVPLLNSDQDYDLAIDAALSVLDGDRPNVRVVHYTVASAASRFVLAGAGVITGMSGLDAWVDGASVPTDVYQPYDITDPYRAPLDANSWTWFREPSGVVALQLLDFVPSSGVLRVEFSKPHDVHETDPALSSVRASDVKPLAMLVAAEILQMKAISCAQNTGTSSIPTDIVDHRSQSDIFHSRSEEMRKRYKAMIGTATGEGLAAASAVRDFDVQPMHRRGSLFHGSVYR